MKLGLIGLGKMGRNLALNIKDNDYDIVVYNRSSSKTQELVELGFEGAFTLDELLKKLDDIKVIWLMLPSGKVIDEVLEKILPKLNEGDVIIDGGNSNYKDSIRRSKMLKEKNIYFLDVGTSGGTLGARNGACMMIGGEKAIFEDLKNLFSDICKDDGFVYTGESGSGHFVKMIHNGIEYAIMQSIGEGFSLLETSNFDLNLKEIADVWNNGSIIESYLLKQVVDILDANPKLENIEGKIDSSGEGLWTVLEALNLKSPAFLITQALLIRYNSKIDENYSNKLISAMRNKFGGHKIHKKQEN